VRLIADDKTAHDYVASTTFMLAGPWNFSLEQYERVKPIMDWVGVRFLVLDRVYFNVKNRTDDVSLLSRDSGVQVAYEDDRVRILASPAARTKAEFWSAADVYADQASVLAELKSRPESILGPPKLEASGLPPGFTGLQNPSAGPLLARVQQYLPNEVKVSDNAPASGIVVLKDVYSPDWHASLNGEGVPIVRVNGFARGVLIPHAGHYDVSFVYQPASFVKGLWLAAATAGFLISIVCYSLIWHRHDLPWWAGLIGAVLVLALLTESAQAYFRTALPSLFS
jgi:hypothetical protein